MGESKYKILQKIDSTHLPKTLLFEQGIRPEVALAAIKDSSIQFPFIAKPDVGQGGWLIELIQDSDGLARYISKMKMPFIIQEYVDLPIEVGLLYYRYPESETGTISSLSIKEMLTVTGDGRSNIEALIKRNQRASTQLQRIQKSGQRDLNRIPLRGECVKLSFIANHSYGTTFRNSNHLICPVLIRYFDQFCKTIDGFYFGRFDIRCASIDALTAGNFKVLELNGVGSEPLHIFDPNERIFNAYRDAFKHWKAIYDIAMMNRVERKPFLNVHDLWNAYQHMARLQRMIRQN